jgi:CRP/FNR family cyclic AMP-dependent transcriptional regulator
METPNTSRHSTSDLDDPALKKVLAFLPVETYRAGETILTAGSKSGRLLILKSGAVVILKNSVEIARVKEPGAVFGEISALLNLPHTAEVRTLENSEFHVADAALLGKDPIALLHVAKILAWRLVVADEAFVELRGRLQSEQFVNFLNELAAAIEKARTTQPFRGRFFGQASDN